MEIIVVAICLITFLFIQGSPNGAELFKSQGCMNCHSFKGKGGELCPDLTDVTRRRNDGWIRDQIKDPKKHNPGARMPDFGYLSYRQISAIIGYLKS
jgi:cytochrome c2